MKTRLIVFPHQLFRQHPGFARKPDEVVLIEDSLFFGDDRYPLRFHKQKLWLHRASMKRYEQFAQQKGFKTRYVNYEPGQRVNDVLKKLGAARYVVAEPVDFILEKRLGRFACEHDGQIEFTETPLFLNSSQQNEEYRAGKKRWFMADFYKFQRRRLGILMDGDEPVGGKWSFDADNRKKVPKKLLGELPSLPRVKFDETDRSAAKWVNKHFASHPGNLDQLYYPTSHKRAANWLDKFLSQRFELFGDFEDAIVEGESWLWHSVLTPMLNIGLLTPQQILDKTLKFAATRAGTEQEVPINSLEGFIRQIVGWREFMRATYDDLGVPMRTTNHWSHHRAIPDSFWTGTTGIVPVDDTIRRVLDTGYCHHIERLMVLGGFMFLCEFDPQEIYRWFMEMFVDSYDWVMVPNAYAMSQNADGGLITTKPYFSGSSYVRKMSHYAKGDWCEIWDGLYWRWIWNHVDELGKNPRWAMMCSAAKKMEPQKREQHLQHAERFLASLDGRSH